MTVLEQLAPNSRVAIIRLRSLGDCVLTTPALSILHEARPDLAIAVVVEPRFSAIFRGNPAVRYIFKPTLRAVAGFRPRLCLNLHGGTRSMVLTAASMAAFRAGFAHHKGSAIYNHPIPRAQQILGADRTVHTAEHLASAMFHLGVPRTEISRACLFAGSSSPESPSVGSYAVIHAVAATREKTWPADGFKAVAEHLRRDHGLQPIFIAAVGEDLSGFAEYRTIVGARLEETMALLRGAALFVGNDSGPAHIAAAFGVPVVVLFGPSDPVVWSPWRTSAEVLSDTCGIDRIPVHSVIAAVDRLKVRA